MPKEAFITFKNEETFQRAVKLNMFKSEHDKEEISSEGRIKHFILYQTQEPSNIIYTNLYYDKHTKKVQKCKTFAYLFFLLLLTTAVLKK